MREVGEHMRCEAIEMVPTEDDATAVRCPNNGRVIREHFDGRTRLRSVCPAHGYDSAMEVS